jgi:hypothetical protein
VTSPACRRCADLDDVIDALTEIIRRLAEQPEPAGEQPAARSEQQCEDRHTRLNGALLRCARPAGHAFSSDRSSRTHSDGCGSSWAVAR